MKKVSACTPQRNILARCSHCDNIRMSKVIVPPYFVYICHCVGYMTILLTVNAVFLVCIIRVPMFYIQHMLENRSFTR